MRSDVVTTAMIKTFDKERRRKLYLELIDLYQNAFPKMPAKDHQLYVDDFFSSPYGTFLRTALLLRDAGKRLVAAALFDKKVFSYRRIPVSGIYSISRAVLPEYQSAGLGKQLAQSIFTLNNPSFLFTTCAQSASLHSWLNLKKKGLVKGYEVYPQFSHDGEETTVNTIPKSELADIYRLFINIYKGVALGDKKMVSDAAFNLSPQLVRKNLYKAHFSFHPWRKNGRKDHLAEALGVTPNDGILLLFKKK